MLLYFPCSFLKCLDQLTDVALRKGGRKPSLMTPGMCASFNNPRKGMQAARGESSLEGQADQLPRVTESSGTSALLGQGARDTKAQMVSAPESYSPNSTAGERQHNSALLPSPV